MQSRTRRQQIVDRNTGELRDVPVPELYVRLKRSPAETLVSLTSADSGVRHGGARRTCPKCGSDRLATVVQCQDCGAIMHPSEVKTDVASDFSSGYQDGSPDAEAVIDPDDLPMSQLGTHINDRTGRVSDLTAVCEEISMNQVGSSTAVICWHCHEPLPADARPCGYCGSLRCGCWACSPSCTGLLGRAARDRVPAGAVWFAGIGPMFTGEGSLPWRESEAREAAFLRAAAIDEARGDLTGAAESRSQAECERRARETAR